LGAAIAAAHVSLPVKSKQLVPCRCH
jgi:hypothetical protein